MSECAGRTRRSAGAAPWRRMRSPRPRARLDRFGPAPLLSPRLSAGPFHALESASAGTEIRTRRLTSFTVFQPPPCKRQSNGSSRRLLPDPPVDIAELKSKNVGELHDLAEELHIS